MIQRAHAMASRQGDQLFAARVEERIGAHRERGDPLLRNSFECRVDLTIGAGPQDMNLHTNGTRRLLRVSYLVLKRWEVRVEEDADRCRLRHQLMQQAK